MNQIKLKRIGSEIAQELSVICAQEAHDNLLHQITITGTEVSNDLSFCKVFFTIPGEIDEKKVEKELNDETAGYLRTKIADRIEIRHTPKLKFVFDKSVAYTNKIEELISEIHKNDSK